MKDGAIPTLKLPLRTAFDSTEGSQRSKRVAKRARTKEVDEILASSSGINLSTSQPSIRTVSSEPNTEEHINIDISDSVEM